MDMAAPHVLIVCGAGNVSGKEVMALELAHGLARERFPISFVTSIWNDGDFPNRLSRSGFRSYQIPIGFISATLTRECLYMTAEQLWRWPGLMRAYARTLRLHRPEKVIHTSWHHLFLLMRFLRPERDVFWLHDIIPDLPQYRRVFGWLERRLESFICVSHAVAHSLRQIGISEAKIQVIHNGLRDPSVAPHTRSAVRGRFRIGIVGQVGPWKGHDDLLEAFALVRRRHPIAELHVFGAGNAGYRGELVQKSNGLGIAEGVQWHGFVTDRESIYGNVDVCVAPSRFPDPLPTSAIEAGFFGLPTIATCRGGLPEIIEHEVNGLLVKAESPGEIADALCRLIEDPSLRQSLAINARKRAVERFGSERFLESFLSLLHNGNVENRSVRLVS